MGISNAVLGLANAGIVLVVYGLAGLAGYWFARKLELPGIYSEDGNWRRWVLTPFLRAGLRYLCRHPGSGFRAHNGYGRIVHPEFPLSILASLSAGIGEEILFRGFVFGLWAFLLHWLLKRFHGRTAALWIGNVIAALAFAASHLGTMLVLTGAFSLTELSPNLIVEIFILNGVIGLIAGERYMKDGLVAVPGVHFWTDVVFHVLWGLL